MFLQAIEINKKFCFVLASGRFLKRGVEYRSKSKMFGKDGINF